MEKTSLNELAAAVHENAVAHGWWEGEREAAEIFALIHSELSEALEEYRSGRPMLYCGSKSAECETAPALDTVEIDGKEYATPCASCHLQHKKPEGVAVELADCVIRILDYCEKKKIDMRSELEGRRAGFDSYTLPALVNVCHCLVSNAYESALNEAAYLAECIAVIEFWCKENGSDLENAIRIKHEYNKTRPYRHGGKKC